MQLVVAGLSSRPREALWCCGSTVATVAEASAAPMLVMARLLNVLTCAVPSS